MRAGVSNITSSLTRVAISVVALTRVSVAVPIVTLAGDAVIAYPGIPVAVSIVLLAGVTSSFSVVTLARVPIVIATVALALTRRPIPWWKSCRSRLDHPGAKVPNQSNSIHPFKGGSAAYQTAGHHKFDYCVAGLSQINVYFRVSEVKLKLG